MGKGSPTGAEGRRRGFAGGFSGRPAGRRRALARASVGAAFLFAAPASAQVSYPRLLAADETPENWLTYSGNYRSHRFSRLDRITAENAADLRPVWVYQSRRHQRIEATPLVVDGVLYLTEGGPGGMVAALDARTGEKRWEHRLRVRDAIRFWQANRGVALLDERLFVGTQDARLVTLDRGTGSVLWTAAVADNRVGHQITAAPLAVDGKVIVGISGGNAGVRGFLDAYDAATGKRAWRFWTVPAPDEPGGDTWGGDSWKTGGGATWVTGSYDPELGLLYWPTGNPAPAMNGDSRPGDNLYTASLLALDIDTGELRWHFQFTPHDVHDRDANQSPVLVDIDWEGRPRRLVVTANRNAFYYVLDRETGEFLLAAPFARQTWAEGIAENGRPIPIPAAEPSEEGASVWPGISGAANWEPPAYDPDRRTLFVPVRERNGIYYKAEAEYRAGARFEGGRFTGDPDRKASYAAVRALDALSGEVRWEYRHEPDHLSGVLATAGGVVVTGGDDRLFALDADTGEVLWEFRTGLSNFGGGGPISYAVDGEQYIAVPHGRAVYVFGLGGAR